MTRLRLATSDTFDSFRVRNFRLFFGGQVVSQVGNWLTLVAQTLLVLSITHSGFAVGLLAACQFGPVLLFGAWAGVVADRSDKRRLLLIVQTVAMGQSFALATLAFMGSPPVGLVFAVASIGGLCMAFDNPARRSFVVEMVDVDRVQNAVGLNTAAMTSSRIVGPALAGLLAATVGFGWCFLVDGLSYLAVIAALWCIDTSALHSEPVTPKAKGQVRAGLRYVRRVPDLWIPLVMMGVVGTLAFNFQVVLPLLVTRTFGAGGQTFTLLFSVMAVGSLAGALVGARRKSIDVHHVVVASMAFGATLLLLAASPSLRFAFPIGLLLGFASISFMTTSTAIVQMRAAPAMRGRVLALQAMLFLGSTPIGGPILGAVCDAFGARSGLVLGGIAALGAALWGELALRRAPARDDADDGSGPVPVVGPTPTSVADVLAPEAA